MAGRVEGDSGGIFGLLDLLEEHWEALDYDLLTLGLDIRRIGHPDLDWRRLRAVVTFLPSTSAFARSVNGPAAAWTVGDYLLAQAVDALHAANWQRAGGKGQRPKPVPRPGKTSKSTGQRFGTAAVPLSQAVALFGRRDSRSG